MGHNSKGKQSSGFYGGFNCISEVAPAFQEYAVWLFHCAMGKQKQSSKHPHPTFQKKKKETYESSQRNFGFQFWNQPFCIVIQQVFHCKRSFIRLDSVSKTLF